MPELHERIPAVILYGSAVWTMYWGFFIGLNHTGFDDWVKAQKGGHLQFLTIQGLALAAATLSLGLIHQIAPSIPYVHKVKRTIGMVSLPLAFTISIIYWPLVLFAPSLIMPLSDKGIEGAPSSAAPEPFRLDLNVDLSLHGMPAISLLLDFLLFERQFSPREMKRDALAVSLVMAVWYGSWVEYCASHNNGTFPYPFLTISPFPVRVVIYFFVTGLALSVLHLLNPLHPDRHYVKDARKKA